MKPLAHYTGERLYRKLEPLKRIRWLRKAYGEVRYVIHVFVNLLPYLIKNRLGRTDVAEGRQATLTMPVRIPEARSHEDVVAYLRQHGIRVVEGGHTVYVPPQADLDTVLGDFVRYYPADSGFKMLKNVLAEGERRYLSDHDSGKFPRTYKFLMGSLSGVFEGACVAEILGWGPRIYDLVLLKRGGMTLACFVVQHVEGSEPTPEVHRAFLEKVEAAIRAGLLGLVPESGLAHVDFVSPSCSGNLLVNQDGQPRYVDFQQFIMVDRKKAIAHVLEESTALLHFGDRHELTGRKYPYQSIPGSRLDAKRDSRSRWQAIRGLLVGAGIELADRIVLDVCCNSGMMMGYALSEGAFWGVGWDVPEVARAGRRIQVCLGNTRLTFRGCELHEQYRLRDDIPTPCATRLGGAVVLYLAVWQHIGIIQDLGAIDWRALVFEGHENESPKSLQRTIDRLVAEWSCKISACRWHQDGHSESRPLVLLERR